MNEEQKQQYSKEILDLIYETDIEGIEPLENKLNSIKTNYGFKALQEILNIPQEIAKQYMSILDLAADMPSEITKLLLIHGARPLKKSALSILTGKIILDIMQQKKGETFSPTFIEYASGIDASSDETEELPQLQMQQFAGYLHYMHELITRMDVSFLPINKTFILSKGYHWSCCQLQFNKRISGEPQLQMFFIDASGLKYWDIELSKLCVEAQQIFGPQNINIYRTKLEMQNDSSCKIFSLVFARMMHSFNFGKFKQANPDYDLFKELATISTNKHFLEYTLQVKVTDLPMLPAKFVQLTQNYFQHPVLDKVKIDDHAITNSRGRKLGDVIRENLQEFEISSSKYQDKELRNMKIARKFISMRERLENYFAYFKSDKEKLDHLNLIERKFSVDALPRLIQRPSPR